MVLLLLSQDPLLLLEDIEELKPTIFAGFAASFPCFSCDTDLIIVVHCSVPRLYNRLYDRILAAVGQG